MVNLGPEIDLDKKLDTNDINLFWISFGTALLWLLLLVLLVVMLFFLIPFIFNPATLKPDLAAMAAKAAEEAAAKAASASAGLVPTGVPAIPTGVPPISTGVPAPPVLPTPAPAFKPLSVPNLSAPNLSALNRV